MGRFSGSASLGPLGERRFFLLFAGRTISMLGSTIAPVALAFAVVDLTGSPSDLGLVLAASFVPQILFLVVGGVWADRVPRHVVMVSADLVGAAAQGTLAVLLLTGTAQVWHIVCVACVRGVAAAFFMPASTGVVPQTVSPGQLQQANAILGFSRNTTAILGAAGGGLLVAGLGPGLALAVDAATYVVGACFLAFLRLPPLPAARRHFAQELREGWAEFRGRQVALGGRRAVHVHQRVLLGRVLRARSVRRRLLARRRGGLGADPDRGGRGDARRAATSRSGTGRERPLLAGNAALS